MHRHLGGLAFPAAPSDFFPKGAVIGYHLVFNWTVTAASAGWVNFLSLWAPILKASKGYGVAALVTSGDRIKHGFDLLKDRYIDWHRQRINDNIPPKITVLLNDTTASYDPLLETFLLHTSDPELRSLTDTALPRPLLSTLDQIITDALEARILALRLIHESQIECFDSALRNIINLAGAIHHLAQLPHNTIEFSAHILDASRQRSEQTSNPWHRAWTFWRWLHPVVQQRCASPQCCETFASAERSFSNCSRCGVARYCSKRCQKLAWAHPAAPHRAVCGDLRLFDNFCVRMSLSADMPGQKLPVHMQMLQGTLVQDLARHFDDLTREQWSVLSTSLLDYCPFSPSPHDIYCFRRVC